MMRLNGLLVLALCGSGFAFADQDGKAATIDFNTLAASCAPTVHSSTLRAIVSTESGGNPFAIGVVGGRLARQPKNIEEAIATAHSLESNGFNFSLGLSQVNRHNLAKYGESYATVFDPCRNLRAGAAILEDCYQRSKQRTGYEQQALREAFSCYYSGSFLRGFVPDKPGQRSYVERVVANAGDAVGPIPVVPAVKPQDDGESATAKVQPISRMSQRRKATDWVIDAADADNDRPKVSAATVRTKSNRSREDWLIDVDDDDATAGGVEDDGAAESSTSDTVRVRLK